MSDFFLVYVKKRRKRKKLIYTKSVLCYPMLSIVVFSCHLLSIPGKAMLESSGSQTFTQFKVTEDPKEFFLWVVTITVYYIRN